MTTLLPRYTDKVETDFTSTSSTQLFAPSGKARRLMVVNDSDVDCYLRYGTDAASTTAYTVKLPAGGTLWTDDQWANAVQAILSGTPSSGKVLAAELT